jgi:uncharacterized protein
MNKYKDSEFHRIVKPLLDNCPFEETKKEKHHGITRYEHSMRVAYFSYKVTKILHLDYKETTEAALLHDFFTDEVKEKNGLARLRQHPTCAVENAKKYFELSDKQEDIIKTHMFPVTFTPPKYLESWIVDLVDDAASIYERATTMKDSIKTAVSFIFVFIINYIKMH